MSQSSRTILCCKSLIPARMAAFANCIWRMSFCVRNTIPAPSFSAKTKAGWSFLSRMREKIAGDTFPSSFSFSTNRPVWSIIPSSSIIATASIRPLPHIERGKAFPITSKSISSSFTTTASIAPSAALLPQVIRAPSRAGPAAQLAA